jgi:hypothetical protein
VHLTYVGATSLGMAVATALTAAQQSAANSSSASLRFSSAAVSSDEVCSDRSHWAVEAQCPERLAGRGKAENNK